MDLMSLNLDRESDREVHRLNDMAHLELEYIHKGSTYSLCSTGQHVHGVEWHISHRLRQMQG